MNDYERTVADIEQALVAAETAYYNAQDEDLQTLIDEAMDRLRDARERAEQRV